MTEQREPLERLGDLFDAHRTRLYRLARRITGDDEDARDLVQEAFVRAARRPGSVPGSEKGAEAWLVRILVNLCRDRGRRRRVRRAHPVETRLETDAVAESATVARATVRAALAQLPAKRRAVVVLRELEDLDTGEVASLLGMSRVTVRWHLHAARKDLRRILGAGESGDEA